MHDPRGPSRIESFPTQKPSKTRSHSPTRPIDHSPNTLAKLPLPLAHGVAEESQAAGEAAVAASASHAAFLRLLPRRPPGRPRPRLPLDRHGLHRRHRPRLPRPPRRRRRHQPDGAPAPAAAATRRRGRAPFAAASGAAAAAAAAAGGDGDGAVGPGASRGGADARGARAEARAPARAVAGGGAGARRAGHGPAAAGRRGVVPAPDVRGELHGRRGGEGAAPPAERGAGARRGAPPRRGRALRRPRRRLRPPLLRPAQTDQDVRRVARGDGVGARAEGDGGRPGVRRRAVEGHRLVLRGGHQQRVSGAGGEEGEAAAGRGGRARVRVRQRRALGPQKVGLFPRLRAGRLPGLCQVRATVGRRGVQQVEGNAQP